MKKTIKKSQLKRLVESVLKETFFHRGPQNPDQVEDALNSMHSRNWGVSTSEEGFLNYDKETNMLQILVYPNNVLAEVEYDFDFSLDDNLDNLNEVFDEKMANDGYEMTDYGWELPEGTNESRRRMVNYITESVIRRLRRR